MSTPSSKTSESDIPSLVSAIVGPKAAGASPPTATARQRSTSSERLVVLRDVGNDALASVNLELRPGEIHGLAGMIGCGRTEILETIFGLRGFSCGEYQLKGKAVTLRSPVEAIQNGIALVPEDRHLQGLVLDHSIERNLAMPRFPRLSRGWPFLCATWRARALRKPCATFP